jgi:hypothetical protein
MRVLVLVFLLALGLIGPAHAQNDFLNPDRLRELAAGALAKAIQTAHDTAIERGAQPMPAAIKAKLKGVFPDAVLDKVTYTVGGEGSMIAQAFSYGDVLAITFIDTIVFQKAEAAENDDVLWAHELTHVMQYDRWGVDEFARRYAADYKAVEDEAYGFQHQYEDAVRNHAPPPQAAR